MLKGKIISVISTDPREAESFAEGLGKKKEEGKFYRKSGEDLVSVLVPKYDEIFSLAEAVSLSDYFCFLNKEVNKEEAFMSFSSTPFKAKPNLMPGPTSS